MEMLFHGGTIIAADNTWALWAVLALTVAISIFLEQKYKWASNISAPVISIIIAFILANIKAIPVVSGVYDTAGTYCIPLATAMMLYQANLKNIFKNSGKMLICMNIGVIATLIGGAVGFFLLKDSLREGLVFTGSAVASYIGGTANFVAVGSSNGLSDTMITVGAFTENFIMTLCIIALLWMPTSKLFKKLYNHPYQEELEKEVGEDSGASITAKFLKRIDFSLLYIAKCVGVALGIVAVSSYITDFFATMLAVGEDAGALAQLPAMIFGNRYVIMTLLSIILVAVFPKFFENMNGAHEIGTFVMYLYFAVIGCSVNLGDLASSVIPALLLYIILGVFNIGILLIVGKLLKQNIEEITIASNACIGGPFTAMAMATSKGYQKLIVPALLSGIWGNILGTILGISIIGLLGAFI